MINHRLGEEYQKIPLPSADAKERYVSSSPFTAIRLIRMFNGALCHAHVETAC
jgi:hypothetical protein